MTSRRAFVASLTGGLLATPLAVEAQRAGKLPRIGVVLYRPPTDPVGLRFRDVRVPRVAVLSNPATSTHPIYLREAKLAARSLEVQLVILEAHASSEFAGAFSVATKDRPGALIVLGDSTFFAERTQLSELAAKNRLPSIGPQPELAEAGYLMAYGVSILDLYRRTGTYVDKILRGAKPADLPVEQATKFELVINLKTAKTLGLTIPPSLLARADQVIE